MMSAFDEIAGYKEEKKELLELSNAIRNEGSLRKAGGQVPRGLFLYGPCGVGKTVLARAFIKETGCSCVEASGADRNPKVSFRDYLKEKFQRAALNTPCILFIDELDKLIGGDDFFFFGASDEERILLEQINQNIDIDGLFLLFVANSGSLISPSILRSGRIDKKIRVNVPNKEEREEIIRMYSGNKSIADPNALDQLARITDGLSGADLKTILNNAVVKAVAERRQTISGQDLMDAYDANVHSEESKTAVLSPFHQRLLAFHEAGHAAISLLNVGLDSVFCATILPRGELKGYVNQLWDENKIMTVKDAENQVKVALAGVAAEEVFLHQRAMGSASDLAQAKKGIERLIREHGIMGFDKIEVAAYRGSDERPTNSSEFKKRAIEEAENQLFDEYYESVKETLAHHKKLVSSIMVALVEKKVLYREDLLRIYADYDPREKKTQKAMA